MHNHYFETVRLLVDAAPFVFTPKCFALKGGTAINLFVEDMPRLSVDIDLVYIDLTIPSRELVLVEIEKALHDVADLLTSKLGVTVRPTTSGTDHESKLFISRGPTLLKVEVNHVFRGSVYPLVSGMLTHQAQERFLRSLSVPMLDPDELYASKLVAALDRQHPRDLFDVMVLFGRGGITPRIRRAFVVYLAGHNRPIHEVLALRRKDIHVEFESSFVGMTNMEVTVEQLMDVRERLFRELPASLDDTEKNFLLSVNRCEPDGGTIGLPGIENLPAIMWKVLNLRKLSKSNRTKHQTITDALSNIFL
jgi:predicted nucleotidyltransferase component of viral defense system